jgi:hypothetical protein
MRLILIFLLGCSTFAAERRVVVGEQFYHVSLTPISCASVEPCGTAMLPQRVRVVVRKYDGDKAREQQEIVGKFDMPCPGECPVERLEKNVERVVRK